VGPATVWSVEQVAVVAPSPRALAAAESAAVLVRWRSPGADEHALWGRYAGTTAEPYDVAVDHTRAQWRCSCPSRRRPCKHVLGLLLLWARQLVPVGVAPPTVVGWLATLEERAAADPAPARAATDEAPGRAADEGPPGEEPPPVGDTPEGPVGDPPSVGRDERVARMREGLRELDRWIEDRVRTGLSDPALARYDTWDHLAARLVDARAGALANRVRRLAGLVGAGPDWHERVLAELAVLHLLAQGGLRIGDLPADLADPVALSSGWQARRADVLAGVPDTDHWIVAGRSDTREDRIEVRRTWLWGRHHQRWAMVLSFAAFRQSLDDSLVVGQSFTGDLHRYPGDGLRALVGVPPLPDVVPVRPEGTTVAEACELIGAALAREPWIERHAVTVRARPAPVGSTWVLTDATGSLPLLADPGTLAVLVAATHDGPEPPAVTVEWCADGVGPLTVHLPDRALDLGPRADPSFVA
jgi:hypothetical protein